MDKSILKIIYNIIFYWMIEEKEKKNYEKKSF